MLKIRGGHRQDWTRARFRCVNKGPTKIAGRRSVPKVVHDTRRRKQAASAKGRCAPTSRRGPDGEGFGTAQEQGTTAAARTT